MVLGLLQIGGRLEAIGVSSPSLFITVRHARVTAAVQGNATRHVSDKLSLTLQQESVMKTILAVLALSVVAGISLSASASAVAQPTEWRPHDPSPPWAPPG
jgi:hypothetical protein